VVLPYFNADRAGQAPAGRRVATVIDAGSPIGSTPGVQTRDQIRIILERVTGPWC